MTLVGPATNLQGLSPEHRALAEHLRANTTTRTPMTQQQLRERLTRVVICLCWASTVVPPLLQSLAAPKYRVSVGEDLPGSPLASAANLAIGVALMGVCVVALMISIRKLPAGGLVLTAALLPWVYQIGRDVFASEAPKLTGLTYPLIVLAIWVLQPRLDELATLGRLVLLTTVISLLMGVLAPDKGILRHVAGDAVSPEKEILNIGILVGPFANGNNLGLFLALGLPTVMLVRSRRVRIAAVPLIAFTVLWTSSRSSLISLTVGALVALIVAAVPRHSRAAVSAIGLVLTASVVVIVPLVTRDPLAFTNRSYIWQASLERWKAEPWTGLGSRFYAQVADYADSIAQTAYHAHNQFVQFTVLGGVINLVLVTVFFAVIIAAAARWSVAANPSRVPVVFMSMFFISATLEVVIAFVHRSYTQPVTVLPIAFMLFARHHHNAANETDGDEQPADDVAGTDDSAARLLADRMRTDRPPLWPDVGPLSRPMDLAEIARRAGVEAPSESQPSETGPTT